MLPIWIIAKLTAAAFALNEISDTVSNSKTAIEEQTEGLENMRNSELRELEQNLQNKNRHQKLNHLYERKDFFKNIADGYFKEKQLLFGKLKSTRDQIREINGLKNDLFKAGQHDAIKELKVKTDELHTLANRVEKEFEEFEVKVKGYNKMVQDISLQIKGLRN